VFDDNDANKGKGQIHFKTAEEVLKQKPSQKGLGDFI